LSLMRTPRSLTKLSANPRDRQSATRLSAHAVGREVDKQTTTPAATARRVDSPLPARYTTRVKTAFFGTPAIGVPALRALHETTELVAVVCQPDKRSGRGMHWSSCAIKRAAEELGLAVYQPARVRDGSLTRWLRDHSLDLAVVFAYGRIL